MPIYEYACEKCGEQIEVLQKVSDEPLKRCRKCRGKLEKLISRTAFQLKGSGWYKTDYANKSASASKSEKSGDTKSESSKSESGKSEASKSEAGKSETSKSETGSSPATPGGAAPKD
jgi:putative FmdB family regulatory protein